MYKKQPSGVTLLELILVIVIIGILAAIMIPAITGGRERGIGEVCISNMRMVVAAWEIYNVRNTPDYADNPDLVFYPIGNINASLGISITENYFGRASDGEPGFFLDYDPPPDEDYQIRGERLAGNYEGDDIIYSSGRANPWAGSWPWPPED